MFQAHLKSESLLIPPYPQALSDRLCFNLIDAFRQAHHRELCEYCQPHVDIKMLEQIYLEYFPCGNFHFVQSTPQ